MGYTIPTMNPLFVNALWPLELTPSRVGPHIAVYPFRTPTLLPATTTNTVVIEGEGLIVVDPATPYADEQTRFDAMLDFYSTQGKALDALVLTHHHIDHMGDAKRLCQERGVPVWAHPETAKRIDVEVSKFLNDGDQIVLKGPSSSVLSVVLTPGHAPGHICLFDEASKTLIAGDMVANGSTILIDPFEGHLETYLASLRRLLALDLAHTVAAHGPFMTSGRREIEETLNHRLLRVEQVFAAIPQNEDRAITAQDLVTKIYAGQVSESAFPFALLSLLSTLKFLVEHNRIMCDSESEKFWRSR
jgi:ribonuclease/clavin/mitogillin